MNDGVVVKGDQLSKRYRDTEALRSVSVEVESGEVFSVIGPNGAGKTTLIRCLTGTTTPDSGRSEILGEEIAELDRENLGVLPQSFEPHERLTPEELIQYYGGIYSDSKSPSQALNEVGIEPDTDTRYRDLSGGQKRRVCVAIALVNDPDVVFLDEPTTGIDPTGRESMWELIRDLKQRDKTVVLTTHYMDEAEELSDRVAMLSSGEIIAMDKPRELIDRYGDQPSLRIEISSPEKNLDGLDCIILEDGVAVFRDVEPEDIQAVLSEINDRSISYDEVVWRKPTLEDVYLELAGDKTHD